MVLEMPVQHPMRHKQAEIKPLLETTCGVEYDGSPCSVMLWVWGKGLVGFNLHEAQGIVELARCVLIALNIYPVPSRRWSNFVR